MEFLYFFQINQSMVFNQLAFSLAMVLGLFFVLVTSATIYWAIRIHKDDEFIKNNQYKFTTTEELTSQSVKETEDQATSKPKLQNERVVEKKYEVKPDDNKKAKEQDKKELEM